MLPDEVDRLLGKIMVMVTHYNLNDPDVRLDVENQLDYILRDFRRSVEERVRREESDKELARVKAQIAGAFQAAIQVSERNGTDGK